jgi:hypothetical protein
VCVLGFLVVAPAGTALADPAKPGNTESIVESVEPATDALRVDIVGGDSFVRAQVQPGHALDMNGYYDEPFLRIERDGDVYVNRGSPTYVISQNRYGVTASAEDAAVEAGEPEWTLESSNGTYLWHDHRVHWMSTTAPQAIDQRGLVQQWVIPLRLDGVDTVVSGSLYVRSAPGSWWWLLAVPFAVVGLLLSRAHAPRVLAGSGAVFGVFGAVMYWGIPSQARGAPVMLALGVAAFLIAVVSGVMRNRSEVVDALLASSAVSIVVASAIARNVVTNRFVPGFSDATVLRIAVPIAAGLALGMSAAGLKRLLEKPAAASSN